MEMPAVKRGHSFYLLILPLVGLL